jgi:hypothetical protein
MRSQHTADTSKRSITSNKDIMKEMYSCKDCDCGTYPWCSNRGGLCSECVDLTTYTHKKPLRKKPGRFGSEDPEASPQDPDTYPEITYPYITVIDTPPDGDCLYKAISFAFDEKLTVQDLRQLVARFQTDSTYGTYRELSKYMPEYTPVKAAHNIRDFRILIKKCGQDVGCSMCVWGDENALQIFSTFLRLGIIIFNEKGQYIQKIVPEKTNTYPSHTPSRYVLLILNGSKPGNEHFNLLQFNKHTLLTPYEWEKMRNLRSGGRESRTNR